jgi:hypothetical protein
VGSVVQSMMHLLLDDLMKRANPPTPMAVNPVLLPFEGDPLPARTENEGATAIAYSTTPMQTNWNPQSARGWFTRTCLLFGSLNFLNQTVPPC